MINKNSILKVFSHNIEIGSIMLYYISDILEFDSEIRIYVASHPTFFIYPNENYHITIDDTPYPLENGGVGKLTMMLQNIHMKEAIDNLP